MGTIGYFNPRTQAEADTVIARLVFEANMGRARTPQYKPEPDQQKPAPSVTPKPQPTAATGQACTRCHNYTGWLQCLPGEKMEESALCRLCSVATGKGSGLPRVLTQLMQLIESGVTDLPGLLTDLQALPNATAASQVSRWRKGLARHG